MTTQKTSITISKDIRKRIAIKAAEKEMSYDELIDYLLTLDKKKDSVKSQ